MTSGPAPVRKVGDSHFFQCHRRHGLLFLRHLLPLQLKEVLDVLHDSSDGVTLKGRVCHDILHVLALDGATTTGCEDDGVSRAIAKRTRV